MPQDAVVGRLIGAALLALAFTCWNARVDAAGFASRGLVAGMVLYKAAAAALLSYSGFKLGLAGKALWPVAMLHLVMTIWCAASKTAFCSQPEGLHGSELRICTTLAGSRPGQVVGLPEIPKPGTCHSLRCEPMDLPL